MSEPESPDDEWLHYGEPEPVDWWTALTCLVVLVVSGSISGVIIGALLWWLL